jgi:hypothetical protein
MSRSPKVDPNELVRELRRRVVEDVGGHSAAEDDEATVAVAESDADEDQDEQYVNSGRGGVVKRRNTVTPDVIRGHAHLAELFDRVNSLLGDSGADDETFRPHVPDSLAQTGMNSEGIEKLVMKYLLQRGSATGREISAQVKLPFSILDRCSRTGRTSGWSR